MARAVTRNPRRTKPVEKGAIPRSPATNCWAARSGSISSAEGKSNEFVLHARNDVFDVVGDLNERWQNRLTLDNPNFVERYVKVELHILVYFRVGMIGEQYVAILQGENKVLGNKRNLIWPIVPGSKTTLSGGINMDHSPWQNRSGGDSAQRHSHRNQESVFVDIIKLTENPERVVPTFVWLKTVDNSDSVIPHALYFSLTRGFVFRGIVGVNDRETNPLSLGIGERRSEIGFANFHDVPRKVIKGASEVLDNVSGDNCDVNRCISDRGDVVKELSCLRVALASNFIGVGVKEGADLDLQVSEVLFGPSGL